MRGISVQTWFNSTCDLLCAAGAGAGADRVGLDISGQFLRFHFLKKFNSFLGLLIQFILVESCLFTKQGCSIPASCWMG